MAPRLKDGDAVVSVSDRTHMIIEIVALDNADGNR